MKTMFVSYHPAHLRVKPVIHYFRPFSLILHAHLIPLSRKNALFSFTERSQKCYTMLQFITPPSGWGLVIPVFFTPPSGRGLVIPVFFTLPSGRGLVIPVFFFLWWSLAPDLRLVKTILAGNFRSFRVYSPEFS